MPDSETWRIDELDRLEAIEEVTRRYQERTGAKPVNVSHWNTSSEFKRRMLPLLNMPHDVEPIDYLYSYYVEGLSEIVTTLGFDHDRHSCLLTTASTSSIVAVVHWLRSLPIERLIVFGPCYFTVVHACRAFGVTVEMRYMRRVQNTYRLQPLPAPSEGVAVLVTNPTYATGQYLDKEDVSSLAAYARAGGVVVLDEALAVPWLSSGRHLGTEHPFAAIYSPHKSVSVNAFKFSAILVQRNDEDFFDQWADVLTGSLPASSIAAVNHYLSPDFDEYAQAFLTETSATLQWLRENEELYGVPTFDRDAVGNYVTFFFPSLAADLGYETDFLWEIAQRTGAVFIPAIRSYFDPALGLGLRVNLALDSPLFRGALRRLFAALRSRS